MALERQVERMRLSSKHLVRGWAIAVGGVALLMAGSLVWSAANPENELIGHHGWGFALTLHALPVLVVAVLGLPLLVAAAVLDRRRNPGRRAGVSES